MLARNLGRILGAQLGQRAVSMLEYGMIAMLVAIAAAGAMSGASAHVSSSFAHVAGGL